MAIATVIPLLLTSPAHANTEEDIAVQPPEISVVLANNEQLANGLLFVAPKVAGISGGTSPGPGVRFWYQHNPVVAGKNIIRIFDNESNGTPVLPYSRIIWIKVDPLTRTAALVRSIQHPEGLPPAPQGGAQALDNGDTLVGWGSVGRFSEFDVGGHLIFDAAVPSGYDTYRAYRFVWHGDPRTKPTATAQREADGSTIVHAIWNGATDVFRWDVLDASGEEGNPDWHDAERGHDDRRRIASVTWNGLDTIIPVGKYLTSVRVVAMDRAGREIGRSDPTAVSP